MIRASSVALLLFLLAGTGAACLFGLVGWDLHKLVTGISPQATTLIQRWTPGKGKPDALIDAAYNFIHATNDNLNRPCGGGKPCGTLATLDKAVVKAGDATVTTQREELKVVPAALGAFGALEGTAQHLQTTADASTAMLNAGTVAFNRLPALEDAYMQDGQDLDALLKNHAIERILSDTAGMTDSGNQILFDARKIADAETKQWLKPVPWYMQPVKKSSDLLDIGAAIARHTP